MKLRKKKRGSTLITVIMISAILLITGTAIISVTAADYKIRQVESEKIKNLYEADSGLNVIENIIIKASQQAISFADSKIKSEYLNIEENQEPNEIKNKFKEEFYKFLTQKVYVTIDGEYKEVTLIENLILNKTYIDKVLEDGSITYSPSNIKKNTRIVISENNLSNFTGEIILKVQASFDSEEGELKNTKTLETTFIIKAPEYNFEISRVNIYPVFDNKAITIDGNLNITGGSNNILGDIWVKGNYSKNEVIEYAFDKYRGGILLDNTSLKMEGNLYTASTFHLRDKVIEASITGDLYANNLYVGKSGKKVSSDKNSFHVSNNLILNNDLALNSTNSTIKVGNYFYGINDKNIETESASKAMNSSSIIVNDTSKTSSIVINNDSYIMGVAYINAEDSLGNKYQTGESVAVKGNYLAYTDVKELGNDVILKYYNPLQLLESIKGDSSANMKANYFKDYYNSGTGEYPLNQGGVSLNGKVYSVGASIKDNQVYISGINEDVIKVVKEKQNDFATNVLAMGDSTGINNLNNAYSQNSAVRTVANQIDFSKVNSLDKNISIENGQGFIIIGDGQEIEILDNTYNGQVINKGLIITNGDIKISGDFNFEGTIIGTGNLTFNGNYNRNISYSGALIRDLLYENEFLQEIFKTTSSIKKAEEVKVVTNTNIYDKSNFLNVSSWKIVK